jgi:transposase
VIKVGTLAKIRRLHLREGVPIKEIERRTGIARNTIKTWLRRGQMVEPKYPSRVIATKLDDYAQQLVTWLKADAHRGKRDRRTVKLMYEELAAQGYQGGYGRVAAFARRWRKEQAGSANKGAFVPLKFALGEAFQFDWSTEYAFVGGLRRRLEVAHTKLCASRAFWLVAYPTQSHEMLFDAHARAFAAFGGVPQRGIFDNAKSVVIDRDAYGEGLHRWNDELKELAEACGFTPRLCRPYRAKTKGKVERFNSYLKGSFVVPLAATLDAGGLKLEAEIANVHVRRWLDEVANARVHATTRAVPAVRLAEERAVMLAAPALKASPMVPQRVALPVESLQHPLSVYDELLEVA